MSVLINSVPPQSAGRKRQREDHSPLVFDSTDEDLDLLIGGAPKRNYYAWEGFECNSSPLTPESGITDMSSPPCVGAAGMDGHENAAGSPATKNGAMPSPGSTQNVTVAIGGLVPTGIQPQQRDKGFLLQITDQPEENYRARYDSEGCRGPMKGRSGGYPTVEVVNESGQKWTGSVKVELVGNDCVPLQSCLLDSGDARNVNKKLLPSETSRASFENLRIRRLKKQDTKGSRAANNDAHAKGNNRKTKQDEKIAYLFFTADIKTETNGCLELRVKSEPIYLNANHDPPEIHRIIPAYGSSQGGEQIVIVGTRMHSPRVSFYITASDGTEHELSSDIDREISHQNALVVPIPSLSPHLMTSQCVAARVVVTAGKGDRGGREPLRSNTYLFHFIAQDTCKECYMKKVNRGIPVLNSFNGPQVTMFTGHPPLSRQQQQPIIHQHINQGIYTGSVMNPSMQMMRPAGRTSPPAMDFPPVSVAASEAHLRGLLIAQNFSPPPSVTTTSQIHGGLDDLLQDTVIAPSPPLSAASTHSVVDIPTSVSSAQVSHLEPSINEVMPFSLSDPSGPVSPEEMSQYLNDRCHSDFLASTQEYIPDSTSAFVTDPLLVSRRQQQPTNNA